MTRRFKIGGKKTLKKKTKRDRRKKRKTIRKKNKSKRMRNGGTIENDNFAVGSGFVWNDPNVGAMKGYIKEIYKDRRGKIEGVLLQVKYPDESVDELYFTLDHFNSLSNRQIWGDNAAKQFIKESENGRARMLRALQTGRIVDPHASTWGTDEESGEEEED